MSKAIYAPIDHKTELTRPDIAKLAKVSISKVIGISTIDKFGFPPSHRRGPLGVLLYLRAAVESWIKKNDIKKIVIKNEFRKSINDQKQAEKELTSSEVSKFIFRLNKPKFATFGKSMKVHVPERNDAEIPHSQLTRFSNSEGDYLTFLPGGFI